MEANGFQRLIEILGEEVDLLRRLHSTLENEQQGLVNGDVESIQKYVESQISILSDVSRLEDERMATLRPLGPPGEESQASKLEMLIEGAPEQEAQSLQEIRASLREVLEGIGSVNKHNGMLISQSLSYIDRTLKMIAGEDSSSTVYTAEGRVTSRIGQIAVDRKI